jgi:hypothetical protein
MIKMLSKISIKQWEKIRNMMMITLTLILILK